MDEELDNITTNKVMVFDKPDFFSNIEKFYADGEMNDFVFNYLFLMGVFVVIFSSNKIPNFHFKASYLKTISSSNKSFSDLDNSHKLSFDFQFASFSNLKKYKSIKSNNIFFEHPIRFASKNRSEILITNSNELNMYIFSFLKDRDGDDELIKTFEFLKDNSIFNFSLYNAFNNHKEQPSTVTINALKQYLAEDEFIGFLVNNFYYPALIRKGFSDTKKNTSLERVKNKI